MSRTLSLAVGEIGDFVDRFAADHRCGDDDMIDLATALMQRAEEIWTELGSREKTAMVFYHLADLLAAPDFDRRDRS